MSLPLFSPTTTVLCLLCSVLCVFPVDCIRHARLLPLLSSFSPSLFSIVIIVVVVVVAAVDCC